MSTIYNVQTFDKLPLSANVPSTGSQLINKTYGDSTYQAASSAVTLAGTNAWTGTNSYNTNLPTSTQTPTSGSQLITKTYGDGAYAAAGSGVSLSGTNAWTGANSYNTNLPTSTVTPSGGTDLITKTFADGAYGRLGSGNTWTSTNIFNSNPTFPSSPTVGYVPTCTNATTGAWTWQVSTSPFTSATVATTDATPTTLASYAIPTNGVVTISGTISAANSLYTDACGGKFSATVVSVAGVATIVSTALVAVNSTSSAVFNVIVTGTNLIVQVTGIAVTTYNWKTQYQVVVN